MLNVKGVSESRFILEERGSIGMQSRRKYHRRDKCGDVGPVTWLLRFSQGSFEAGQLQLNGKIECRFGFIF